MRTLNQSSLHSLLPSPGTLADDEIESVYGHAYSLAEAGQDDEAAAVLARLSVVAPYSERVWQALGAVLSRLGEVRPAAVALTMATLLRGDDEPPPATLAIIEAAAAGGQS